MPNLEPARLLQVWENNWNRTPCEQAVALVANCFPELTHRDVLDLPIGRRDVLLMSMRSSLFGSVVVLVCKCHQCEEQNELSFDLADVDPEALSFGPITVESEDIEYRFRLPCSEDLLEVQRCSPTDARLFVTQRCLLAPIEKGAITSSLVDRISDAMGNIDRYANLKLDGRCANCGNEWDIPFDIVSVLWIEFSAWAQRLIGEIHVLASNYGWNESEILALSPVRRQIYLSIASQ